MSGPARDATHPDPAPSIPAQDFRTIFDHSNDAAFVLAPEADRIVYANPKACELLEYAPQELIGMPISEIHPDEVERFRSFAERVRAQGIGWTDELSCTTKTGKGIPAEISASTVTLDGDGYVVAWVRDVTDRRAAEAALRASEERFRVLVENAAEGFYLVRSDGSFLDVNQQAIVDTGYSREELLSLRLWDVAVDRSPEYLDEVLEKMKDTGPITVSGRHRRKDGSIFPVEVRARRVDWDGSECLVALARDVTERERAERALRESEERFRTLVENAADALYLVDHDGTIIDVNPQATIDTGYTRDELVGQPIWLVSHGLVEGTLDRYVQQMRDTGSLTLGGYHVRKDGSAFPVEVHAGLFEWRDRVCILSLARDITERVEADRERQRSRLESSYLREELQDYVNFGEMIGESPPMQTLFRHIEEVADTDSTVLITGETGTGKELVARAIHGASARKDAVLVRVNCAALSPSLIESELFGHERGAFTGATSRRVGRFELADRGTILLDEVGDLPADLQAKLLRVLQEGEFERVGATRTISVDVRVLAATNHDLEKAVEEGRFRADLYYRLRVFPLHIPPLRERRSDIPLLVHFFLDRCGKKLNKDVHSVPSDTMAALASYDWPGNVRELENVIERGVIISGGTELHLRDWGRSTGSEADAGEPVTLDDVQRHHILKVLDQTGWQLAGDSGAARLLGIKRTTLHSRMKKLGITRPD